MAYFTGKKFLIELGIAGAVVVFFIAGVLFESQRRPAAQDPVLSDGTSTSQLTSPGASDGTENAAQAEPTPTLAPGQSSTTGSLTATPKPGTTDPANVGRPVFLQIEGLENETVTQASSVSLSGTTTPDALLSVNGQIVAVDVDGTFAIELDLEPGPNIVEFVSSNLQGQTASRVVSIVSEQ